MMIIYKYIKVIKNILEILKLIFSLITLFRILLFFNNVLKNLTSIA